MPISIDVINSKFSRPGDFRKTPLVGFSVDWFGHIASFTVDRKGFQLGLDTSEPSKLKRLNMFPRMAYEFDYAGKRLMFKNVPVAETVANTPIRSFSLQRLWSVMEEQLKETRLPSTALKNMR